MFEPLRPPMFIRSESSCSEYERIKKQKYKKDVDCLETISGKIRYGGISAKGWKKKMEDTFLEEMYEDDLIWCIFDGHGGKDTAQYCEENWKRILTTHPLYDSNLEEALRQTFLLMDIELYQHAIEGGTTATCLIIRKNVLYVGCVGDSGAVAMIFEDDMRYGYTELTRDDRPDHKIETERILRAGLQISKRTSHTPAYVRSYDGTQFLNMSRALGDFRFKRDVYDPENQGITCVPHVSSHELLDNLNIFVSSDGIWESVCPRSVACFLGQHLPKNDNTYKISDVLDQLVNDCVSRKGGKGDKGKDNITCFLIQFCCNGDSM